MMPLTMFLSMVEMEKLFVNIPVSHRLDFTTDTVMIQLGGRHGVTYFFIEGPFSMMTVNLSGR